MLRITDTDTSSTRILLDGLAITTWTRVTVVQPAEISWEALVALVRQAAQASQEEPDAWEIDDDPLLGTFYAQDWTRLLEEVACSLNDYGVSITHPDTDAWQLRS